MYQNMLQMEIVIQNTIHPHNDFNILISILLFLFLLYY